MITLSRKGLKNIGACEYGVDRFSKGRFWCYIMNKPVALKDVINGGHNTVSDMFWMFGQIQKRIAWKTRGSRLELNQVVLGILMDHELPYIQLDAMIQDVSDLPSNELAVFRMCEFVQRVYHKMVEICYINHQTTDAEIVANLRMKELLSKILIALDEKYDLQY